MDTLTTSTLYQVCCKNIYKSALYQFIFYLDYVLRTSIDLTKENSFKPVVEKSRRYPAKTITDADSTDDIAFLTNSPA